MGRRRLTRTASSRRDFLKKAGALAVGAAGARGLGAMLLPARASSPSTRPARPNILLIVNDEERHWRTVEPLVDPLLLGNDTDPASGTFRAAIAARMRLRRSGVRFSNYFTPTAPCSPARGVLYTGHHAPDNQVVDNMDFDAQMSLRAEIPTVADVLTRAGYYCAYKGKVHLAKDADLRTADDMLARYGFHDWQGPNRLGDSEGPLAGALFDDSIAGYAADWLATTAGERNGSGQPWLLAVNFINPHDIMLVDVDGDGSVQLQQGDGSHVFPLAQVPNRHPYFYWWSPRKPGNAVSGSGPRPQAHDEFASLLSAAFGNIPLDDAVTTTISVYRDNAQPARGRRDLVVPMWQAYLNYYLNCMVDNDAAIATVLDALTAAGLENDTIVLFTADHGELAMSHMAESRYVDAASTGAYQEDAAQADPVFIPLRQKGPFVYQENCNLPLVVANLATRADALVHTLVPSTDVDLPALASTVDLLPTFLLWARRSPTWYARFFGRTAYKLAMRRSLPGVSLHNVIREPGAYPTPQWSDGRYARRWVLFTSDAVSALDADYAYLVVWNQCSGSAIDPSKRGMLRGLFDGRHKYVRYFSPLDYGLNAPEFAALDYAALVVAGTHGQDLQLFDLVSDPTEVQNVAADAASLVTELNQTLQLAMERELHSTTRVPATVETIIEGGTNPCAEA